MNKFLLAVSMAATFPSAVIGQDTLGMALAGHIIPDTVCNGSEETISVLVQNKGTTTFSGYYTVSLALYPSLTFIDSVGQTDTILPNDTVLVTFASITFDTLPPFQLGGNVVVIWPSGNFYTNDSLIDTIEIVICTGLDEAVWDGYESLNCYPNPSAGIIYFTGSNDDYAIEQVRIYTPEGRMVDRIERQLYIDMGNFGAGVYLLEVQTSRGIKTFRVIKK